jgi:hypothetical protein
VAECVARLPVAGAECVVRLPVVVAERAARLPAVAAERVAQLREHARQDVAPVAELLAGERQERPSVQRAPQAERRACRALAPMQSDWSAPCRKTREQTPL